MRIFLLMSVLFLGACSILPPVQEMAAARSAISTAKSLPNGDARAEASLKSAEQALEEAARSIEQARYEQARHLAIEAKRKAQRAAILKQGGKSGQ